MTWRDDLQAASWRGVPFGVDATTIRAGRNTAVHAYPYRESDVVWVEDLGLAPRRLQFIGFLVGDDVSAQQEGMVAAAEQSGPGELVHPLLGSQTAVLIEFSAVTRKDRGRAIEMTFDFIVQSGTASPYPAAAVDTKGAVTDCAATARTSTLADLGATIGGGIRQVQTAVREVQSVAQQALSVGRSAASLIGVAGLVPGNFGRFLGGGAIGSALRGVTTVQSAISTATRLGSGVVSAANNLTRLAARL